MRDRIKRIYGQIEKLARQKGVEAFELYVNHYTSEEYCARKNAIDNFSMSECLGVGLRLFKDKRIALSFSENLSADYEVEQMFSQALAMLPHFPEDPYNSLPAGTSTECDRFFYPEIAAFTTDDFKKNVLAIEKDFYQLDKRVINIPYTIVNRTSSAKYILNSRGLDLFTKENSLLFFTEGIFQENSVVKTSSNLFITKVPAEFNRGVWLKNIVKEGLDKLDAQEVNSGKRQIVISAKAAAALFGSFLSWFSAERVQKKLSPLAGKIGRSIAASVLTIVDRPRVKNGLDSGSYDDEGAATRDYTLVENGVLKGFLHNSYTAAKDRVEITGHAKRRGFNSNISIGTFNTFFTPGKISLNELLRKVDKGLYVTALHGLHAGINSLSGDFSLQAEGYVIDKGELKSFAGNFTITGNFLELLMNLKEPADDVLLNRSDLYTPSWWAGELSVSGKE